MEWLQNPEELEPTLTRTSQDTVRPHPTNDAICGTSAPSLSHAGPFSVIDADNRRPIRTNRITQLNRAFDVGDNYAYKTGGDYIVLDARLNPVPRPRRRK